MQRTYSDPDLPQLMRLPERPQSSYDPRPKVQEHAVFKPAQVEAMAQVLKIDLDANPDFHWIIRDCLLALRQEGYQCTVVGPDVQFQYLHGRDLKSTHPIVIAHQDLVQRLLRNQQELKDAKLDPHYRLKVLVFNAIMGEKDVRRVCTPKMLEEAMACLDVNCHDEPYLIQRIKVSIEDAYFRMKRAGGHTISINNCLDVDTLIVNLELDRVGFLKKIAPSGLLYCVECQTQLGDVIATGCHDVLCNACAVETHSTGNRQDVPMVFIEQSICSECKQKAAVVRCQDCVDLFCYDCFKLTHRQGKRQRHCVGLPQRTFCFECDMREASYICVECEDALCSRCSTQIHRQGARQNHTLFGLRKAAYNKKLFADNLDRLMGILTSNIERSYSLSPWFVVYDAAVAPLWYNFQTSALVRANPNDLTNPPVDEDDEDGLGADDQLDRGLPGATVLTDTHAARFAAQAVCFDVPPPMVARYVSPQR